MTKLRYELLAITTVLVLATVGVAYAPVAQTGVVTITDESTSDAAQLNIIRTDSDTDALLINALGGIGEPTTFNVASQSHNAIFSLRSIGGSPQVFLADDDDATNNNPQYRMRLSNDLGRLDFSYKEPPGAELIRMSIANTGNVGIGTVNPTQLLDVNGILRVRGDSLVEGNLDLTGTSAVDDDTIFFDDGTATFFTWDEAFQEFVLSNGLFINGFMDIESFNEFALGLDRIGTDGSMLEFFNDGVFAGDISVAGTIVSYNAFTGSHYAWSNQEPQRGILVSMNGQNKYLHEDPEAEILYGVDITTKKNDPAVLGAFLTFHEPLSVPGLVNPLLVMAEGNGEVWVADMGVDIQPGDYLISSFVAGHAMKDDRSEELSHIIGRAAEPIDWSEVEDTIDGVKHKKISILFNFVPLNNNIVE